LQIKGNFKQVEELCLGWKFIPQNVKNSNHPKGGYNFTLNYREKWIYIRWSVTLLGWKLWTTLWWNKGGGYLYPKIWW